MKPSGQTTDIQLSVIIPVYNCVTTLQNAIRSVRSQPYSQSLIIIIDDGSTDGSSELCDKLAAEDQRIVVIHKENGGVSRARNLGIEYALAHHKTGYIAFLDADDYWCANAVTDSVLNKICNEPQTDIFSFGGFRSNSDNSSFSRPYEYTEEITAGGNSAIWKLKGHFCANLYSVPLLRTYNIRFFEGLKYSEDVIFRLQCAFLSKNIHFLSQKLYCYQENTVSTMSKVLQIPPIDYYIPIINGWLASDDFINSHTSSSGQICHAGHVLSGIYFVDMAIDHYKRGYCRKKLNDIFATHPNVSGFKDMRPEDVSRRQYKNHLLLKEHPILFEIKYRFLGYIERTARWFALTAAGRKLRNKWRYPLDESPRN